ncbi:unnamed protein product [Scytosiphon promiscuus]
MVSNGVVRQHFLPPHAGGVAATRHVGSPLELFVHPDVASRSDFVDSTGQQPPAPAQQQQLVPETGSSHRWLQGPLRECARRAGDDGALARSLLDAGAATDFVDRAGRSPLHWACTRGNTSVVVALLDAGADGLATDSSGKTPLHCAAQVGHTTIVVLLLEHYGFLPLGSPASAASFEMVAPNAAMEKPPSSVSAVSAGAVPQRVRGHNDVESMLDARNAYGSTALHRAAFNGREGVVLALLRGGAGVGVLGKSGRSALHLACRNAHAGCVQILLAWGADESTVANDGTTAWSELARALEERPMGCPRVAQTAYLLNAARSARAWGRRGWLLMLREKRSRELEVEMEMKVEDEESDMTVEDLKKGVQNMMRCAGGACNESSECSECHGEGSGLKEDSAARRDVGDLVGRLLDIGEEGCFRLVIGFL